MAAIDYRHPLWLDQMPELAAEWDRLYIEHGDDDALIRADLRKHAAYDTYFAGNLRDSGEPRLGEELYLSVVEGYQATLISVDLNPATFADSFATLIENDVDVSEFTDRVEAVRAGVIDRAPAVVEYYAEKYGIDMSEEAVFASLLDPTVSEKIIDKTIAISQIGASAAEHGFDLGLTAADELFNQDLDIFAARRFFGEAEAMLPTLQVLTARHEDPDDTFDLAEFTQAEIMADPRQRQRIRRLIAQEGSTFSRGASGAAPFATDQSGRRSGLEAR